MRSEAIREHLKAIREYVTEIEKMNKSTEAVYMKVQLNEINRAIRQFEKRGIQVPGGMLSDKSALESKINTIGEAPEEISSIYEDLLDLISHIGLAIRRRPDIDLRNLLKERRRQTTPRDIMRKAIVEILEEKGGSGTTRDILKLVEEKLIHQFTAADKDKPYGKSYRWQMNVRKERNSMIRDGLLTPESKRGRWTLAKRERFRTGSR